MPADSELTEMSARWNSIRVDEGQGQMYVRRQSSLHARRWGEDAEEVGDTTASSGVRVLERDGEDSRYWWVEEEYNKEGYVWKIRCVRRRHGWYHVHEDRATCRFCSAYSGNHLSDRPKRALSSRALESAISRFPPEVIHRIVEWCVKACYGRPWGPGMVCRHWANVCLRRTMPFDRHDELKGREDVMTLQALVSAPGSYLKHNVTSLGIEYYLDENTEAEREQNTRWELTHSQSRRSDRAPWLHLLPATRRLLPNYHKPEEEDVTIRGPLPKGIRSMRSIHAYLPRPMPPSFSHGIKDLRLVDIQFRQLADLQHVLDELPSLCVFQGKDLSWPPVDAVQMMRVPHHKRGDSMSKYVELEDCTSNLEAITLFASLHDERTWGSPLRTLALSLGLSLSPGYRLIVETDDQYEASSGDFHDHKFHVDAAHTAYRIAKAKLAIEPPQRQPYEDAEYLLFACIPLATSLLPSDPRLHIEPAIHLAPTYFPDLFNWKTFHETFLPMTQLLGTCGVRVRRWAEAFGGTDSFYKFWRPLTDSEDDTERWQFIKEHLPLLFQAGKIEVPSDRPYDPESSGSDDKGQESESKESDPLHHVDPIPV